MSTSKVPVRNKASDPLVLEIGIPRLGAPLDGDEEFTAKYLDKFIEYVKSDKWTAKFKYYERGWRWVELKGVVGDLKEFEESFLADFGTRSFDGKHFDMDQEEMFKKIFE